MLISKPLILIFLISPIILESHAILLLDEEYHWPLYTVGALNAWNLTQGSPEIVVSVIDSGVDFSHPDLENQSWMNPNEIPDNCLDDDNNGFIDDIVGWDFRSNDNDPSPGHEHGTFIAGIISGDNDNDLMVGIAPNIKLMAVRFLDNNNGFGGDDWGMFAQAVNYSVDNGAHIIQLSIEAYGIPPTEFHTAIKYAYNNNVTIVGVTGNDRESVAYPGKYPEVIAVSATTQSLEIADFSSPGEENEICAPGDMIYSITPATTTYSTGSGTSFASPLVSGTIALMLSLNRTLTPNIIRQIIQETSTDLGDPGKDDIFGYGILNTSAAVEKVFLEWNKGIMPSSATTSEKTNKSSTPTSHLSVLHFSILNSSAIIIYKKKKRS